jgi:membrane protein
LSHFLKTVGDIYGHVRHFFQLDGRVMFSLLEQTASEWAKDKVPRLAASLAYYTLLSLAPLLVIAVACAAFFFGQTAVQGQLFWETRWMLGNDGATAIQGLLKNANHLGTGLISTVLGALTLVFGASSAVVELTDALNTIWGVPVPASGNRFAMVIDFAKERLYSLGIVFVTGLILLLSLAFNTIASVFMPFLGRALPLPGLLHLSEFLLAVCITTILFSAIYKILPAVLLTWADVFIGACFTSLVFTAGKLLLAFYLVRVGFSSSYGAAGSLVLVLVWIYYSAQLFFFGAEFTKVYARRFGSHKQSAALPTA